MSTLSDKIAGVLPRLSSEQNAQVTAYCANKCHAAKMPLHSVGDVQYGPFQGKEIVYVTSVNGQQKAVADVNKAVQTPVEQSLAPFSPEWQAQQMMQQPTHLTPIVR